ncbi:histone H2B, gonadal-like [Mytilus edulis]|uniref:histone H2B, gonadal-like n=1 Tax=Mytilus edulis TaxID=6550 RepID=UPI0039EFE6EB
MPPKVGTKRSQEGRHQGKDCQTRAVTKKRRRKRRESYAIYIYKVLRQVHPDTGSVLKGNVHHEQLRHDISRESQQRPPDWHTTTKDLPSHPGRSRPLSVFLLPENWPSTLSVKVPKAVTKYTSSK